MGHIIYLDGNGGRNKIEGDQITYHNDHWRLVVDEYEKADGCVQLTKFIPRERIVEVEAEQLPPEKQFDDMKKKIGELARDRHENPQKESRSESHRSRPSQRRRHFNADHPHQESEEW